MTANPRVDGPMPPEGGLGWCAMCASLYKGEAITSPAVSARIQEAIRSPRDETVVLPEQLPGAHLQEAVAIALLDLPMATGNSATVPAPACWSHLKASKASSIALATGMEPLLGQGRPGG